MFPTEIWFAYTAACILLVLAPGPDNLLAIGRGLSQGRLAACVSGLSSGVGIVFHVVAANVSHRVLGRQARGCKLSALAWHQGATIS